VRIGRGRWSARWLLASCLGASVTTAPIRAQIQAGFGDTVEVRRAEIDVVVTDAAGLRVRGLGRADFELLVDGMAVEIREFAERPSPAATSSYTAPATASDRDVPADVAPPTPATGAGGAAGDEGRLVPVTWVIYVDSGLLPPGPKNDALRQLAQFLNDNARPQDRLLIAGFDGRNLRFLTPLASMARDRTAFDSAVAELMSSAGEAVVRRGTTQQLLLLMQQTVASGGAGVPGDSARQGNVAVALDLFLTELEFYIDEETRLAKLSLRALDQLISLLAGVQDQRVAVVVVGGPLPIRPGEAMFLRSRARLGMTPRAAEFLSNRIERRILSLAPEVADLFRRANAGRLTFFTVDAASGEVFGLSPVEDVGLPAPGEGSRYTTATADLPLSALAAATGGRAFLAGPQLATRLREVAADLESYYSLAFEPVAVAPGYRRIEVRLKPAGLVARYREGFSERARRDLGDGAALTTLLAANGTNDLGVRATIAPLADDAAGGGRKTVTVRIELPLADLVFAPPAAPASPNSPASPASSDGLHRGSVSFHFAVADGHREYRRLEAKDLEFTVPDDKLAQARREHVVYTLQLPAAYRGWRLAIVVLDEIGGSRSTIELPVDPAP
jgi:VWFA-related protein